MSAAVAAGQALTTLRARVAWAGERARWPNSLTTWTAVAIVAAAVLAEALWLAMTFVGATPYWNLGMDFRYYAGLGQQWLADRDVLLAPPA